MEAKLKHLEFIQAAISRMATNSFLFKGWAITIAAGLSAFGTANTKAALLTIALVATVMFWVLDGYYLWLERGFVDLHIQVAAKDEDNHRLLDEDRQNRCCVQVVQDMLAPSSLAFLRLHHRSRCSRHNRNKE